MIQKKRASVTMSVSLPLDSAIWVDDFAFERNYGRSQAFTVLVGIARTYFAAARRQKAEDVKVSTKKKGYLTPEQLEKRLLEATEKIEAMSNAEIIKVVKSKKSAK